MSGDEEEEQDEEGEGVVYLADDCVEGASVR